MPLANPKQQVITPGRTKTDQMQPRHTARGLAVFLFLDFFFVFTKIYTGWWSTGARGSGARGLAPGGVGPSVRQTESPTDVRRLRPSDGRPSETPSDEGTNVGLAPGAPAPGGIS